MYELAKKLARENNDLLWYMISVDSYNPLHSHVYQLHTVGQCMYPFTRWTMIAVTERYIHCRGGG